LTLQGGQGYDFSEQVFTPATLGDVYYDAGWFMMDGDHWEILDMGPLPLTELGRLPGVWDYEAWGMGAWDTNGLKAVAGRSYAIRTWEYERYALVHVLEAHADRITVEWLYVNAKSWPGEYRTGGLSVYLGVPRLAGFTLQGSGPDGLYVQSGGLSLVGDLRLFSNGLRTDWAVIQGTGRIVLDANTTWRADRVFLRCDVTGPGTLTVMDGSEFRIEHRAAVSLSEGDLKGSIECDGLLLLKDQVLLRDTLIRVNRLDSQDEACLDNCVIQAEAGAPYGQFFVSGQAAVNVPAIRANGDRYLDVDPKVYDCNNLRVGVIDVLVDEGVHGTMGGLFELRGLDIPNLPWEPNVYVHPLTKVPDFGPQTWTIDRLELVPGARLNLTNRFDFQAPFDWAGGQEVLFVKDLVLGEGAILNTAFNRVYCERLIQADSARIISIPLLGFSLNNIAFDDERDFSTRVKTHNTIATDLGMSDVFVSRVVGQSPDPRGMMRMRNLPIDGTSVHALAQGLFAKAGEDTILVRFEYLFETSSGQLAVYLTDSTEMLESDHPERENHYSLVGQVLTPPAGRPGSAGSGTFATFEMRAAAGRLDFYRGVRIELELVGPAGTSVLIDNWDPLAQPNPHYCWDLVQPNDTVDAFDFLAVMSESGKRSEEVQSVSGVPMGHYLEGFFCRDGYVTVLDAMAANWHMCGLGCPANDPIGALAVSGLSEGGVQAEGDSTGDAPICPGGSLLAVGKTYSVDLQGSDDFLQEALYGLDAAGAATPCGGVSGMGQMNIRLVKGPEGEVYAVNLERGLVKVGGVQPLIRTRVCSVDCEPRTQGPATVYVGMQGVGGTVAGLPILDAAFDESGDLYVVPVVVSPEGTDAYVAGARLRQGGGGWSVVQLYAPQTQANDNIVLDNLREIETDCRGRVLVLNVARQNRSDAVLVFDRDTGLEAGREDVAGLGMESPGAMRLVGGGGVLVLGGASSGKACVVAVSVGDLGQSGPHGRLFEVVGMDQVTGLAEDPGTGAVWVTGIVLEDVPAAFDSTTMLDVLNRPPFYSGCVASLMVDQQTPVEARPVVSGGERTLSLPLAVEWFDPLR